LRARSNSVTEVP